MSTDEIKNGIATANTDIASQSELIAQIQTALEGKAAGSGGASVKTCTVTFNNNNNTYTSEYRISYTVYEDGAFGGYLLNVPYGETVVLNNVVCGSVISLNTNAWISGNCVGVSLITDMEVDGQIISTTAYGYRIQDVNEALIYIS